MPLDVFKPIKLGRCPQVGRWGRQVNAERFGGYCSYQQEPHVIQRLHLIHRTTSALMYGAFLSTMPFFYRKLPARSVDTDRPQLGLERSPLTDQVFEMWCMCGLSYQCGVISALRTSLMVHRKLVSQNGSPKSVASVVQTIIVCSRVRPNLLVYARKRT